MKLASATKRPPRTDKSDRTISLVKTKVTSFLILSLIVVNVVLISHFVHRLLTDYTPQPPINLSDIANADVFEVRVLNGCGISGLANTFSEILKRQDYDVVETGNAETFEYKTSILIDHGKRDQKQIQNLCKTLGISTDLIIKLSADDVAADATVIIGSDYQSLRSYRDMR
ncbi:LytR C-terminal domain-containing protein [candidate division KSB1 bacterium]|nr:LytR C-terminal domain-containing protein [candidate division KSB1 bacterium]